MEKIYLSKNIEIIKIKCSNNCIFCIQANGNHENETEDLSSSDERALLDITNRFVADEVESLRITGSEPLKYSKILSYLRWIRPKFKRISIYDPMMRLSNFDFAKSLFETGIDELAFSIFGSEKEIHDACTGNPGSFDKLVKALENIEKLNRNSDIEISINSIFLKQNQGYISKIISFLKRYSLRLSQISVPVIHAHTKKNAENFVLNYSELKSEILKLSSFSQYLNISSAPPCLFDEHELFFLDKIKLINSSSNYSRNIQDIRTDDANRYFRLLSYGSFCDSCHLKDNHCGGILKYYLDKNKDYEFHPLSKKTFEDNECKFSFNDFHMFY